MRRFLPASQLARDSRFNLVTMGERTADRRGGSRRPPGSDQSRRSSNRLTPHRKDASDSARALMHGIFVGEVQALEGAGRTCFDYDVQGSNRDGDHSGITCPTAP